MGSPSAYFLSWGVTHGWLPLHQEKAQPYLKRVLESGRGDSDTWVQKTHYLCGLSYRNGLGIPIDNQLSFKHFLSAADQYVSRT